MENGLGARMSRLAFGERASPQEGRTALLFGVAGVALAVACVLAAERDLAWWQWLVLLVVAFDIVGGVPANATLASTRQYHRPGEPHRPLLFAAGHIQPFALVLVLPELGLLAATCLWLAGLAGTLAAVLSPSAIRRAVALGCCTILIPALFLGFDFSGLDWLVPAFLLKLVAAHAVPMWSLEERPRE